MKRWPSKTLGEVVDFVGGGTPRRDRPDYWGGDIPWASVKDLQSQSLEVTIETITAEGLANSASNLIPAGTVLIASRVGLGKVAINRKPVAINQDLKALTPRDRKLHPRFLLFFLLTKAKHFEQAGVGATVKGLTLADYQRLTIPMPPLTEQERIVRLLDEAAELRKLRVQADHRTAALIPALFHEMFGDPTSNSGGWPLTNFDQTFADNTSQHPKLQRTTYQSNGRFPVIDQGKEFIAGYTSDETLVADIVHPVVLFGDHTRIVKFADFPFAVGADGVKVLAPQMGFNAQFLVVLLQAMPIPNLGYSRHMREVKRFRFIQPPLALQNEFAQRVTEFRELAVGQATSRARLDNLFQSMLHRAFNGEL